LREIASEQEIVVSTQVLIELRAILTRKLEPKLSFEDVRTALTVLSEFEVISTDANLVLDAHELAEGGQLPWFDALILEAAIRSRCTTLYSEDFSHGREIGGLTVYNPFLQQ
jgi:predicted nucleic acid-binding protein